jgi:hypothetical protein
MVGLGGHDPDQLLELLVGGGEDGTVVVGADREHQSLAVDV